MNLAQLVKRLWTVYEEKGIARCRYNALEHIVTFIKDKYPMAESDISILKTIEKQQMKDAYEQTKSNNRLNGAEKQAINDIYKNLIEIGAERMEEKKILTENRKTKVEDNQCQCLPPFVDADSEILVLGTMPGKQSLQTGKYYSNARNSFWKIIRDLFNDGEEFKDYQDKCDCLKENHIALWDVLATCEREGSLDENIKTEVPNDIAGLLQEYPNIKRVVFNGKKPKEKFAQDIKCEPLTAPSTSGANTIPYKDKLESWKEFLIIKSK